MASAIFGQLRAILVRARRKSADVAHNFCRPPPPISSRMVQSRPGFDQSLATWTDVVSALGAQLDQALATSVDVVRFRAKFDATTMPKQNTPSHVSHRPHLSTQHWGWISGGIAGSAEIWPESASQSLVLDDKQDQENDRPWHAFLVNAREWVGSSHVRPFVIPGFCGLRTLGATVLGGQRRGASQRATPTGPMLAQVCAMRPHAPMRP